MEPENRPDIELADSLNLMRCRIRFFNIRAVCKAGSPLSMEEKKWLFLKQYYNLHLWQ